LLFKSIPKNDKILSSMGENDADKQGFAPSAFHNNAVFFIETDKVHPNPYQPRREFDESRLQELAGSIRMYGVLQPLVVTRKEIVKEDGGLATEYELIAGERRLRASKIAGLREVPALIRSKEDDEKTKLELAIIENLQREDLNPIDRARAFQQLADEFDFTHGQIAKKVGRSREYVTNTIRLLALPEEMLEAISNKKIAEGHARPLLMLSGRPEEQNVLFKEIMLRKMTVRDAEKISRSIAKEKARKVTTDIDAELFEIEKTASEKLGTRVHIEPRKEGGRIRIDFLNRDELKAIMAVIEHKEGQRGENSEGGESEGGEIDTEEKIPNEEKISESTPLEFDNENNSDNLDKASEESGDNEDVSIPDYSSDPDEIVHADLDATTLEDKTDEDYHKEQEKEDEKKEKTGGEETFSLDDFNI
jgi:ParB family chromosome partitioning protein